MNKSGNVKKAPASSTSSSVNKKPKKKSKAKSPSGPADKKSELRTNDEATFSDLSEFKGSKQVEYQSNELESTDSVYSSFSPVDQKTSISAGKSFVLFMYF